MNELPLVYMAGPLFDEGERWWIETMDELVRSAGFRTFLPHRDNPPKTADNARVIYDNDKNGIDECTLIVANLNGLTTDDGTAWELGYGFARGKLFDFSAALIINRYVFYAALPLLLFRLIATSPFDQFEWFLVIGFLLAEIVVYAIGYVLARKAFRLLAPTHCPHHRLRTSDPFSRQHVAGPFSAVCA